MTHISDIAAVLLRGVDVLNDQMSSSQSTPLSDDDRRYMMRHLMVTVETAAKLADVAHLEALATSQQNASGAIVDRTKANTEQLKDVAESSRAAVERAALNTGGERTVGSADKEGAKDIACGLQDTDKMKTELGGFDEAVERPVQDMEVPKAELERVKSEKTRAEEDAHRSFQDTEKMNAQMERLGLDVERTVKEMDVLKVELEKMRSEGQKVKGDVQRALAQADMWLRVGQLEDMIRGVGWSTI